MKKVVITGATSMIGLALINACIKEGVEILALCRENSAKLNLIPKSKFIKVLHCDLSSLSTISIPSDNFDVFFHLGWTDTNKKTRNDPKLQAHNIDYTLSAVEFAKKIGCRKFIGAGSQAEYGRVSGKISPNHSPNPDISYGVAKYAAGVLSRIMCNEIEMEHSWTRIFSIYGQYDNSETLVSYLLNCFKEDKLCNLTNCEQMWDFLHVDDCAKALISIAKHGKNGSVYNIGSGKAQKLKEFVETISQISKTKAHINYGSIPYTKNQVMHLEADIENLTKDTGFFPTISFEDGIKSLLKS